MTRWWSTIFRAYLWQAWRNIVAHNGMEGATQARWYSLMAWRGTARHGFVWLDGWLQGCMGQAGEKTVEIRDLMTAEEQEVRRGSEHRSHVEALHVVRCEEQRKVRRGDWPRICSDGVVNFPCISLGQVA